MKRGLFVTAFLLIVCLGVVLSWSVSASSTTLSQVNALQEAFCDSVSEIPVSECQALVALYESTDGANWTVNTGWLATYTPCSWHGISCDGDHVSSLSLGANQLAGSIPPELGDLAALLYMGLPDNQLTGPIPPELGSLSDLIALELPNNALGGEAPPELASLVDLFVLDVGYNALVASDSAAASFLDAKDPDWWQTQTVPPADLAVTAVSSSTVELSWTPIPYTADGGYYEVVVALGDWNPYTVHGTSADKLAGGYLADGLAPGEDYYFAVHTHTPAHGSQQNDLWSGYTPVVSATTEPGPVFSVSGQVLAEEGGPIPGVEVWAYSTIGVSETVSATTDAGGMYAMEGLAGAAHGLYPRYLGWQFAPFSREVDGSADAAEQDFVGFTDEGWNVELVGALGGGYSSVAVQGAYAYAGEGFGMTVLDLSEPTTPAVAARTPVLGGVVGGIALTEGYAFVAAGLGGLQVVDITDPANPTPVAAHDTLGSAASVALSGDYAYIANTGRAQDGERAGAGLEVVNVADPEHPVWVAHYATPQDVVAVAVASGYAYMAETPGWYDEESPAERGLRVLDISDPSAPEDRGLYATTGTPQSVIVSEGYAYLAEGCIWEAEGVCPGGGLQVFDLSVPDDPQELASYLPPDRDEIDQVAVTGDRAYLTAWNSLYVLDVSDPADPQPMGSCATSAWSADIAVVDGLLYLAGGELSVVDVPLPLAPVEVGVADPPAWSADDVVVDGDYAYVAGTPGLQIVDVSQPQVPTALGHYELPDGASQIALHGDYAFLIDSADSLLVVNVSDPLAPQPAGSYSNAAAVSDMAIWEDYLYLAGSGLSVLDISDPANPEPVRQYDLPGEAVAVEIDGGYAYVGHRCIQSGDVCVGGALRILDVSDPTDPFEVGSLPADPRTLAVEGDRVYLADEARYSLLIVDVSDRTAPVELGSWPNYFGWFGVAAADGYAYTSTDLGMEVVDVADASDPQVVGAFDIQGLYGPGAGLIGPSFMDLENGYAYLALDGLQILRFAPQSTFSISGRVTDGEGLPIPDVSLVTDLGLSTTTDATGYYTFTGLITGTYALTPTLEGWSFTPPTTPVTVPPDAVDLDFTGQPLCPGFDYVELQGSEAGYTTHTYTYTAKLIPMGYEPITYTWSPEPLWGQESAVAGYLWDEPGTYSVTVEAEACGPPLSTTLEVQILTHQVTETAEPGLGITLTFTDTQGNQTEVQVPPGAVDEEITLVYTVVETPTVPADFAFAGHAFTLEAYQDGELLPDYEFGEPVTITIEYSDADVQGLLEETLDLRYWTGAGWSTDGITLVERDVDGNRVVFLVSHLSQFALIAVEQPTVYLPLILRGFTVNHPPHSPTDPSPPDGATNQPLALTLAWTGGDPNGDLVTYDVYLDADDSAPQTLVCDDVADASCDPGDLALDTLYYWQVVATDEHGLTTTGPVWAFTTTALICEELIANGGFETTSDWELPVTPYRAAYSAAQAHSGSRSMRTGIVDPTDNIESWSSARQSVTIAADAESATLRFWLYPLSDEPTTLAVLSQPLTFPLEETVLDGDVQYVLILNDSNVVIERVVWQLRDDQAWTYHEADLLDYAGRTIKLQFGTYNDGWGGVSSMYVDDVALEVCTP